MFKADAVLKFGGDALRDAMGIANCARIAAGVIRQHEGRVAIVVSAMKGVTDELLAITKKTSHDKHCGSLRARHFAAARELNIVRSIFPVLSELKRALSVMRASQSGRAPMAQQDIEDLIASFGERLAAPLVAAAINKEMGAKSAHAVDARNLIIASNTFGAVKVDFTETEQKFARVFANFAGVPVITGFIGATREGQVITLGRNGSDYSAAIVLRMLHVKALELWKCVPGVMTADPELVPQAQVVPSLSYKEMFEIAGCGAKIVDSRTMLLAQRAGADIWVRNVNNPESQGTRISCEKQTSGSPIRCIVVVPDLAALDVDGVGLAGVPGMLERAAGAMRHRGISIKFVAQPVSEGAISLAIKGRDADNALSALKAEFQYETGGGSIRVGIREEKLGAVAVIGDCMRGARGITQRVASALARAGVNVVAYAQAANEEDISIIVAEPELKAAANAVHREFFGDEAIGVFVIGLGNVGTEFARKFARAHISGAKLVGVANSKKWYVGLGGINSEEANRLLLASNKPFSVSALIEAARNFKQVVAVDCTSSAEIAGQYAAMAEAGIHIVRANKKIGALSMEYFNDFERIRELRGTEERNSASVGAGQPFLYAVRRIRDGNGVVTHMDMILSGTNNFVLDEPGLMRENLRRAEELGYAETRKNPDDPSPDLMGEDARLKVVEILRAMGWWIDAPKVLVDDLNKYSDEEIEECKCLAQAHGCVLKYVATVDVSVIGVRASVGLMEVPKTDFLARVYGVANGVVIYAKANQKPLEISGLGAGIEQTAQALLADLVDVMRVIKRRG